MSLDVYLESGTAHDAALREAVFIRRNGVIAAISRAEWDEIRPGVEPVVVMITVNPGEAREVFTQNITHNLGKMAEAAGIYQHLWRPEEIGINHAWQLVEPLSGGLERLKSDPGAFRPLNPSNGWGTYEGLVSFVEEYLDACRQNPDARVRVWR